MDNISEMLMTQLAKIDDNNVTMDVIEEDVAVLSNQDLLLLPIFIIFIITGVFGNCLVCLAIYTNR